MSATLGSGLVTGFIRLRAAKKLTGNRQQRAQRRGQQRHKDRLDDLVDGVLAVLAQLGPALVAACDGAQQLRLFAYPVAQLDHRG